VEEAFNLFSMPLVSIGLPTYNRLAQLKKAVQSVLEQDYPNIELVLADNDSTDGTEQFCREIQRQDDRVSYFKQPKNLGPHKNFVTVLERAAGDYFMWLGDDDWLDSTYVGRCIDVLFESPDCVIASGKSVYYRQSEPVYYGGEIQVDQETGFERVLSFYAQVTDNGTFYGLTRRETLLSMTLLNTMGSDWLFMAGLAFKGKIATLNDVHVHRNLGGATDSYEKIAKIANLPTFEAIHPHLSIALNAYREIAWNSPVYKCLEIPERIKLAHYTAHLILLRHSVSVSFGDFTQLLFEGVPEISVEDRQTTMQQAKST
jgi:glycosyltransferase domain-containing protein